VSTSPSKCIDQLWTTGFFKEPKALADVLSEINEKWGHNFSPAAVSKCLTRAKILRRIGKPTKYSYIQKISPVSKKVSTIEGEMFSRDLVDKLGPRFKSDLDDLQLNFGQSGTCSAFLLRKILEKAVYLVFAKNKTTSKLEEKGRPGVLVGLEKMLNIASQEKVDGMPVLTMQTSQKIKGIKFLGDTSAHNPLASVDMEMIIPQMPFIITAYKELAEKL